MSQQEMDAAIERIKQQRLLYEHTDRRRYPGTREPSRVSLAGWIIYLMLAIRDGIWLWIGSGGAGAFGEVAALGLPPFPLGFALPLLGLVGCALCIGYLMDFIPTRVAALGALGAWAGSSCPGVVFFGPMGFLLGMVGTVLLFLHPWIPRYPPAWRI